MNNIYLFDMIIPVPIQLFTDFNSHDIKPKKVHKKKHNPIEQLGENPIVNLFMNDIENEPIFKS